MMRTPLSAAFLAASTILLAACATTPAPAALGSDVRAGEARRDADAFERDRRSILAMAGDYAVTFDFTETVSFVEGYELKDPKVSGARESVRVIEDRGDFISLQHLLVVGPPDSPFVVKHWRQDWHYEPEGVLKFIGGNAWAWQELDGAERSGAWSQTVYQVDDSPRYGAIAQWTYEGEVAEWAPAREWRPLPRRDMTTRDDYHAVDAVNRHVIIPDGWVHEQDNSKLVLGDTPHVLVREVGVNTYRRFDDYPVSAADQYWAATAEYWAGVRAEWNAIIEEHVTFAITLRGETEDLYGPLLTWAGTVQEGGFTATEAIARAREHIRNYVTPDIGSLAGRLRDRATESASGN